MYQSILKSNGAEMFVNLRLKLFVFFLLATVLLFLGPPFFTFDSYDYLHLGLFPKSNGSHPVGLGLLYRGLSFLANMTSKQLFTEIVIIWNAFSISFLFYFGVRAFSKFFETRIHLTQKFFIILVSVMLGLPTLLGVLYVSNAFWSEATNFLHVALFAVFAQKAIRQSHFRNFIFSAILGAWSYQTRYSEVVLPVCFLAIGIIYLIRYRFLSRDDYLKTNALKYLICFAGALSGLATTNIAVTKAFPSDSGKNYVTSLVVTASLQCALRCDIKLFESDCSTEEGKKFFEEFKCRDLIFGLKRFGSKVLGEGAPLSKIFEYVGLFKTLQWVFYAPFTYLQDTHDLEMGLFQYGDDLPAKGIYSDSIQFFADYLISPVKREPNPVFIKIVEVLNRLFQEKRFFHFATAFCVLLSLFIVCRATSPFVLVLSLHSLGSYLLFSYLNPHVPFRYLILIILPALIAFLVHTLQSEEVSLEAIKLKADR